MNRRDFLLQLSAALPVAGLLRPGPALAAEEAAAGWRTFELSTQVDVAAAAGVTRLWLPLASPQPTDYQRPLDLQWSVEGARRAERVTAPGYDVQMLLVEWPDARAVSRLTLVDRFATRDRSVDLSRPPSPATAESAETLQTYLRPTQLLPTDGLVRQTAERITRGQDGNVAKARAIYDWVVENCSRNPRVQGCGTGNVSAMLATGDLSGKCADINGLFVALARAAGVPARDAYGLRVADSRLGDRSLGKSGDVSKAQHCRAEFYAEGYGWVPVDPADVRKLMLEEVPGGLPPSAPKVQAARRRLFGSWEMNWVAYNHGHDVALPGSAAAPVPFLMYPHGETANGRLNSLDPAAFRYSIQAREIA